jgi:1,5-anhydro-D-fructose reductase (1,5-anhydro-D-mannitol-forming)
MSLPASSAPRDTIRWGIIGCGDVTEVKSGPGLQKARGSQLVAVMRRNGALAADYARRHGVARWYDDARALAHDPDVDAIYVATPPGAHLEGVQLAAAAGKPVYVEKPMARNTTECDAMIATCAAAKQKLFVAYYRRALPRFVKAKELLDAGAIGRLTGLHHRFASPGHAGTGALPVAHGGPVQPSWRTNAPASGGGLLLDLGAHAIDLLDFFGGALEEVNGHAACLATPGDVEDAVAFSFRTASGVPGTASYNFASHVREDVIELSGSAGRVTLSVFNHEPMRLETARGVEEFPFSPPPHIAQPLIQTVVDDLLGRGTCPSTGDSARRTNAVMDRVLSRYYGGRDDAFWTRPETWPGRRR